MMDSDNRIFSTVDKNISYIKSRFGDGINLVISRYEILQNHIPVGLVYIETISDKEAIMKHVVKPMLTCNNTSCPSSGNIVQFISLSVITFTGINQTDDWNVILQSIMNGCTILFVENSNTALIIMSGKAESRPIETPENEVTVLGSQESFTDNIKTNCGLILKRLPVPNLKFEEFTIGTLSHTKVKLIWLEGIANAEVINEARRRLQSIDIDNLDGIGALSELIEDKPFSILPKYRQTERPDVVAKSLSNGRFGIICDNSPFAFTAPISLWDNFKSMDDYEERSLTSSFLRIIRYISFVLSFLVSSLYLAFVTYNQAIVPSALAVNIASGREGVPFPSVVELLLLTIGITIIREAGVRMPGSVGYFVGTLAAVVIGQAIVTAGYVSASLIIVVAVSTISSFAISTTTMIFPSTLLNYIFILLAASFGIFGVACGLTFLIWYLITLESFGMPYLYPLLPYDGRGAADTIVRPTPNILTKRMKYLSPTNRVKIGNKGIK